jgi:hypothetical protein
VLIRGNCPVRELTSGPLCLFDEHDPTTDARHGQSGGTGAEAAADDGDIRTDHIHVQASSFHQRWPPANT